MNRSRLSQMRLPQVLTLKNAGFLGTSLAVVADFSSDICDDARRCRGQRLLLGFCHESMATGRTERDRTFEVG